MEKEGLRKQLVEEIQEEFENKLREAKRQKTLAEEELESQSERWRTERRRFKSEVERLESALAEARESAQQAAAAAESMADPGEAARIKTEADEKLRVAAAQWNDERNRLTAQIARLERAVAENIERSANPMRATQPLKEQYEAKLAETYKQRMELEHQLLRVKADWDEDRKKLTGEIVRLRRLVPVPKAVEDRLRGRAESFEESRIHELEEKLAAANSEVQKYHMAAATARDDTRKQYELRLAEADRQRVKVESEFGRVEEASRERASAIEKLQTSTTHWMKERDELQRQIRQLQTSLSETKETGTESVDSARREYARQIREMMEQKTQLTRDLESVKSMLESERSRAASAAARNGSNGFDSKTIESEVALVEEMIRKLTAVIEDPSTELPTIIRKNVEKAELTAYLKGILFSVGKGKALVHRLG